MIRHFGPSSRLLGHVPLGAALVVAATMMAVVLPWSSAAVAASPSTKGRSTSVAPSLILTLSVAPPPGKAMNLVLTSHLMGSSGEAGQSVSFFVVTREFGRDQDVPIGTATTAANGLASISYKPTWSGEEKFVVKLTASSGAGAPTATANYRVTASAPGPLHATANPLRPLSSLGHIFVGALLGIVVLLWLTLIVILLLVARRLPRMAGRGGGG